MGEKLDVAASTVRNRMVQMEERGIIEGYQPNLDYEKAGFQLHILFTCTAPHEPEHFAEDILDQEGVVTVREILGGSENLHVEAVGRDTHHLTTPRAIDSRRATN